MRFTLCLLRRGITSPNAEFQYWNRFVERQQQKFEKKLEWHPLAGWQKEHRERFQYGDAKPWTTEFAMKNAKIQEYQIFQAVRPLKEWNIFIGDRVSTCFYTGIRN